MSFSNPPNSECEKVFEATETTCEPLAGSCSKSDCESIALLQKDTINDPNDTTTPKGQQQITPYTSSNKVDILSNENDGQNEKLKLELPASNLGNSSLIDDFSHTTTNVAISNNKRKSDHSIESNIEEKKIHNMRKNIRGVINESNFDTITINAQREESERLARVQGLKKLVKQKYLHSAIESMVEGVHEVQDDEFLASCESIEPPSQQIKVIGFELKDRLQRQEENKSAEILWNQWLNAESKDLPMDKKEEVVTIDSSSDEDDCIILSDSDDYLEDEAEDHNNSGLHVKDVLNIPNEHGKVMVNVGHVESEPDIFLAPQIAKVIKPHQIGGVRFLFDNIIESTKRFNNSSGFGCILAHSMGLGKTLQVVTFSDIFLRHTDSKTILCVMPINTIQNWVKEYNLWIPEKSSCHEKVRPRNFKVFALNDQHKTMSSRSKVINRWNSEGGVLLIGYELFRVLGLKIIKRKEGQKLLDNTEHKTLLDRMHSALVKPGPDLVICDEGHRIKNAHAGISIALKQIRTRRRIVLTGYPLQNNLLEYWCMVDFVRPNYLGSKAEFCNMFERPIQNGQCIDSTPEDIKLMRYRAHVLHSLLVGFVQRRSDSVLQNSLPQKLEYVILTKMTKFQRQLYDAFMNEVVRKKKVPNPLKAFAVCCKIWNHPDVLYHFVKKREADLDLDIDDRDTAMNSSSKPKVVIKNDNEFGKSNAFSNATFSSTNMSKQNNLWSDGESIPIDAQHPKLIGMLKNPLLSYSSKCSSEIVDLDTKEVQFVKSDVNIDLEVANFQSAGSLNENKTDLNIPSGSNNTDSIIRKPLKVETKSTNDAISYDWATSLIKDYEPGIVSTSPKMQIFLYILEESIKLGDRVLVFSQSLLTLNLMEVFLQRLLIPETDKYWKKNVSYFRLDGSTSSLEREKLVNEFNSNIVVKLFLISTKAGSLGINLTGANRVVVFDASWNPCHDTQAVHRIYRYGQGKSCFVYRIVMDNCLEKNIYDRQVKKQGMSDRVVDECNPDAHLSIRELTNLCYDKVKEDKNTEFTQPIENFTDAVMRSMLTKHKSILSKEPFYHESLLIDRKEKKLSQTEKKLAKRGYEIEKKASSKPQHFIHNVHNVIQNRDCMLNKARSQIFKSRINQPFKNSNMKLTRWIPAEVWQRQGMSSQEMKLPIDVAIPTNSNDSSNIVVKAGEKVMVLNSAKGVYMQLESGKIIAIKTSAETAKDKVHQAKKLISSQLIEKKDFKALDAIHIKDDHFPSSVEQERDSENDDCIVINDSINESSDNSFDLPHNNFKNHVETSVVKHGVSPKIFPNSMSLATKDAQKDTSIAFKAKHQFQKNKEDAVRQRHLFAQDNPEVIKQSPQHCHENLDQLPKVEFCQKKTDKPTQNDRNRQDNPELLIQNQLMQQQKSAEPLVQNHYELETKNKLESATPADYIHKQSTYKYGIPSNYDMFAAHNIENQHFPVLSAIQRWENKSPEFNKQAFKISNIPAPYPSTAVCDLNSSDKNDKQPINDSVNVEQYNLRPPYVTTGKSHEDEHYHHNLNYNLSYQSTNAHTTLAQQTAEDNGSLNALYHFNNKNENAYSETLYENSNSSHSSYHQQLAKYAYGYYQPHYHPNYTNSSSSNKPYDDNTFPSVSSQYYMRRPSSFPRSSINGVDVGFNYAEPQGWMKTQLPE
ncbi:helicase ARIP4 [Episyrphus balteatus]|uniref:helicase ARIP4 n=1 Tax=Episyrphus balteatus TaxID=286459 RepID=UPI0024867D2E|nr:helicase ARIP4 [Episyrphus balteatus]